METGILYHFDFLMTSAFDRFVLYQLSKNLNRPFFMDFLTHLSVHFANGIVCDEEDPDDDSPLMEQMKGLVKPSVSVISII